MTELGWKIFLNIFLFSVLISVAGIYCILVTRNLIRVLIGIELLTKAVTLLFIASGYATGHTALTQSLVITMIIIEVVAIVVMAGVILSIYRHNESLDARNLRSIKG